MVYGIDLGTTNSLIGRGDELVTGLVSSSVNIKEKKQVTRDEFGKDIVSSYKVNMNTGDTGKVPVFCSSIVLKTLSDAVMSKTGNVVDDVVISVPAYFATTQREAVKQAATDAGLNLLRVINEPTAAACYVCRNLRDLIVVYDLGGGTFDVTLIDSRDGNYRTVATDGQILGGDDLDAAMMQWVIKNYKIEMRYLSKLNKSRLTNDLRLIKENIQKERVDQMLDLSYLGVDSFEWFTIDTYKELVHEVFAPTIVKTLDLLDSNLASYEKPKIIYTGGSTYCPYLMELLREEIQCEEMTYDVPKDMLVAHGIAYVAELAEQGKDEHLITNVTKQLSVELDDGTTYPLIENNTILPCSMRHPFVNVHTGKEIRVRLYQGNKHYAKDNDYIGELLYEFDTIKPAGTGLITAVIDVTYDGFVILKVFSLEEDEQYAKQVKLRIM